VKNRLNYIFTSLAIVAIVIGLVETRDWNSTTALFPRVVGIPALGFCIAVLVMSIKRGRQQNSEQGNQANQEFLRSVKIAMVLFAWILGFILLIWILGINLAIPVYVLSYMKVQGKYRWLSSTITAASVSGFVYLVFNIIFRIAWPESLMQRFLGF
jgi:putative tricarboxylic transport membrane protein